MKKLTFLLFAFLLIFCLAACGAKEPEKPDDTTPAETQTQPVEKETVTLFENSKRSPFRLIYSAEFADTEYLLNTYMRNAVESEMWATLNFRDDAKTPEEKEILLGHTNRPESAAALEEIADNEYIVSFDGKKLVLNAKDPYGIKCAVRWFLDEYVKGKTTCSLEVGMKVKNEYEVPEQITILRNLKRGINVECHTYDIALTRTAETFQMLADAGFDYIRLPVDFEYHMDENGNLDEEKMKVIDDLIHYSLDAGLPLILDLHYWEYLSLDPIDPAYIDLFYSMWEQVAQRYRDYPAGLCFQFMNEPGRSGSMDDDAWNTIQMKVYEVIRAVDPTRILFFSPTSYNMSYKLAVMTVPEDDDFIAIDVHDYFPSEFTHYQVYEGNKIGTYTREVFDAFAESLDIAIEYRKKTGIPMIIGEFSASPYLPEEDIAGYLSDVTAYMEQNQIAWTYWEFDRFWAAYDNAKQEWKDYRFGALMGNNKVFMK